MSTNTPTPRTDAEDWNDGLGDDGSPQIVVSADFARQLERQLNAEIAARNGWWDNCTALERECAALRNALAATVRAPELGVEESVLLSELRASLSREADGLAIVATVDLKAAISQIAQLTSLRARLAKAEGLNAQHQEQAQASTVNHENLARRLATTEGELVEARSAQAFLVRLANDGGQIVSSSSCSILEIAQARACQRWLCIDSLGFVYRPPLTGGNADHPCGNPDAARAAKST